MGSPWEFIAPMVGMSVLFMSAAAAIILRGPLGRALADRLAGRRAGDDAETARLRQDVEELRAELGAMQERLDFTERLLARGERGALPGGRAP
jgi:hypothetical protein